jgi:hypothetical protein
MNAKSRSADLKAWDESILLQSNIPESGRRILRNTRTPQSGAVRRVCIPVNRRTEHLSNTKQKLMGVHAI